MRLGFPVSGPTLRLLLSTLLRLLFPSWAFFDEAVVPPMLEVRPVSSGGGEKPWTAAVCAAPRRWFHVCFNPTGTRTLAAQTLVERLYLAAVNDDVGTGDAITARALVGNFVETVATNELRIGAEMCWQWRIVVRTDHSERVVATGEVRS